MTGLSCSITTGPTVTRDCLWRKYSAICSSQSSRLSDAPDCTVLWSSLYWSQLRQAASSLFHVNAVGLSREVSGVIEDWLLISVKLASTIPVRNSSILLASSAACVSKDVAVLGMACTAATVGGETHEGGPSVLE